MLRSSADARDPRGPSAGGASATESAAPGERSPAPGGRSSANGERSSANGERRERTADGPTAVLLRRAQAGDQAAWNTLVDRHTNLLWSVARAYRLGSADAADVVQTTWLRLVEHLGQIHDPERLPGWLVTTANRECLRTLRLGGREVVGGADDIALDMADEDAEPLDAHLLTEERDVALWGCFRQLPDRCQRLLRVLMASAPQSYADVSAALGMPVGSIGPTRGRCLDRLRALVAKAGLVVVGTQIETPERWTR